MPSPAWETSDPQGLDLLKALVDLAEHNQTTPELVELHVTLSAEGSAQDHPIHGYFVRRYAVVLEMVTEAFELAGARGQLRPGVDCRSSARTLVALMDGLQGQWLLDRDGMDMPEELRRYLRPLITADLDEQPRTASSRADLEASRPAHRPRPLLAGRPGVDRPRRHLPG